MISKHKHLAREPVDRHVAADDRDLLAIGREVRMALADADQCTEQCFLDPRKLARCRKCPDDLGAAAERYAAAIGRFREAVTDAVPRTKPRMRRLRLIAGES